MKLPKSIALIGTKRITEKFLWFPKKIGYPIIWLEKVKYEELCTYNNHIVKWVVIKEIY